MEEPTIRPLREGDAEALLRFYQGLSPETVRFYEPYSNISLEMMDDVVRHVASGRDFARVLVTSSGDIVGHVFLGNIGAAEPMLGIGIAERWQNRGYGRRLLAAALAEADARPGVQAVILTVNKQNLRAQKLYQAFGFVIYGECDHREPRDSFRMRRMRGETPVAQPGCHCAK
jgi:RimJ/RimL family protein N-acetyltransferase